MHIPYYTRLMVAKYLLNHNLNSDKGVKLIWNDIVSLMNRELLSIGISTKNLKDYRTAISALVRKTYGFKTVADIPLHSAEVELFVLEIINSIKERRINNGKAVLQVE